MCVFCKGIQFLGRTHTGLTPVLQAESCVWGLRGGASLPRLPQSFEWGIFAASSPEILGRGVFAASPPELLSGASSLRLPQSFWGGASSPRHPQSFWVGRGLWARARRLTGARWLAGSVAHSAQPRGQHLARGLPRPREVRRQQQEDAQGVSEAALRRDRSSGPQRHRGVF